MKKFGELQNRVQAHIDHGLTTSSIEQYCICPGVWSLKIVPISVLKLCINLLVARGIVKIITKLIYMMIKFVVLRYDRIELDTNQINPIPTLNTLIHENNAS